MSETTIATTTYALTHAAALRLQDELDNLNQGMMFVGPIHIPGNALHGWIVRENDGNTAYNGTARELLLAAVETAENSKSVAAKKAARTRKYAAYRC